MHLTHIHTTDQKSMVFYTGLASPELIPRLGHRKKCPKGTRQNVRKKFFFAAAFRPHIRQIRHGCASYSYTPRQSKKYDSCQTFGRARAHTPTQAHFSGTTPARSEFFFFRRHLCVRHRSNRAGWCISIVRTPHIPNIWSFAKAWMPTRWRKKKKLGISDFFGSLWHVARLGHVSHDHATGTRGSSKVRCAFYTKIVGVFRQEPCH